MKTVCLFLVLAAFAVQGSQQASCHLRELDLCALTAVMGLRETPVPQNEEQIDAQCASGNEAIECVRNFTNTCTTPLHRQLISLVTEAPLAAMKDYCTPGSDLRKSALQYSNCLAEAWEETMKTCIVDAQAALEAVVDAPFGQQLDMLCCTYRRYRECCSGHTRDKCGEEGVNFIDQTIGRVVANLPDLVCHTCEGEEDKCTPLLPPPGTQPKGAASNSILSQLLSTYLNS